MKATGPERWAEPVVRGSDRREPRPPAGAARSSATRTGLRAGQDRFPVDPAADRGDRLGLRRTLAPARLRRARIWVDERAIDPPGPRLGRATRAAALRRGPRAHAHRVPRASVAERRYRLDACDRAQPAQPPGGVPVRPRRRRAADAARPRPGAVRSAGRVRGRTSGSPAEAGRELRGRGQPPRRRVRRARRVSSACPIANAPARPCPLIRQGRSPRSRVCAYPLRRPRAWFPCPLPRFGTPRRPIPARRGRPRTRAAVVTDRLPGVEISFCRHRCCAWTATARIAFARPAHDPATAWSWRA